MYFFAFILSLTIFGALSDCGAYDPHFYTCCNGVLSFGPGQSCCGTQAYDFHFYTCCIDVLNFGAGQSCCGTEAYDLNFYTCCNGVLYFGSGLSCQKKLI